MERLKLRAFVLAGVFFAAAVVFGVTGVPDNAKTEAWMEEKAPTNVGKYSMMPGRDEKFPRQTYRMDESTYDALKPFGIVSRVLTDGRESFDVVVIASRSRDSFHNPRVCFTAQGWQLNSERIIKIPTKTRGTVYATLAKMTNSNGNEPTITAYLYRGQGEFFPTTRDLKWSMFKEILKFGHNIDGVFYRFIPNHHGATEDELKEFIAAYLDESKVTSEGYF